MSSRILVIEDDNELCDNIFTILTQRGFAVDHVYNPSSASDFINMNNYDAIILDYMLPGMYGTDMIYSIKKQLPNVKIIMITAFATVENAVEAMKKGADDYLVKPFKINELVICVLKNLEEKRLAKCLVNIGMDELLSAVSHPIRRNILLLLFRENGIKFMDIVRKLEIDDHTKVNFHLKILKNADLIKLMIDKNYFLTNTGKNVLNCLQMINSNISS